MKYAIVEQGSKQYVVWEGIQITVDRLKETEKSAFLFEKILLIRDGDKITVGTPYVKNGTVKGEVVDNFKGKKISISKFKAKIRYRKTIGFRPYYSSIKINKIETTVSKTVRKKQSSKSKKSK